MSDVVASAVTSCTNRPVGLMVPEDDTFARTWRSLQRLRAGDARTKATDVKRRIDALPDDHALDHRWKRILQGVMAIHQTRLSDAHGYLLEAAALELVDCILTQEERERPDSFRLSALALHHTGLAWRRQERLHEARRVHEAAFQLRERFGSLEESWETAIELGLDEDVAQHWEDAARWYRRAITMAEAFSIGATRQCAVSWRYLSISREQAQAYEESVSAAHKAFEYFVDHDSGGVDVARAVARYGTTLLRHGESLLESCDSRAAEVLRDSADRLKEACDALRAFGQEHESQAQTCTQQMDFAKRLLASCEIG